MAISPIPGTLTPTSQLSYEQAAMLDYYREKEAEVTALKATIAQLPEADFPEQLRQKAQLETELAALIDEMETLQQRVHSLGVRMAGDD